VATELSTQETGAFTNRYLAGNVGGGVLERFTVTFDYPRRVMILEPNGREADPPDRSGMWLNAFDRAFRVEAVTPGGPAADAGLAVGDRVLAVDGRPVSELRLPDLRDRLRGAPGTVLRLDVQSAAAPARPVALTLGLTLGDSEK
jgi:membrane-associated protease RseP (regulator of RpoE activity)